MLSYCKRCGSWHQSITAKKRDQPHHDLVQQYQPGPILNTISGIIHELGGPYVAKPGLGGMTVYSPCAMAAASRKRRRAVPVRRITVCGPGGGKIED